MNRFKLYRRLRGGYWVLYAMSGWYRVDQAEYDRIRKLRDGRPEWSMGDYS